MHTLLKTSVLLVIGASLAACTSAGPSVRDALNSQGPSVTEQVKTPEQASPVAEPGVPAPVQPNVTVDPSSIFEPNDAWDKAAVLSYDVASSQAAIAGGTTPDVDWYKFEGKKGDQLEILVRTQNPYSASTLDSYLELYPPLYTQLRWDLTTALASNDDASPLNDGDFGSMLKHTVTADATYYLKVTNARVTASSNGNNASNVYDVLIRKLPAAAN